MIKAQIVDGDEVWAEIEGKEAFDVWSVMDAIIEGRKRHEAELLERGVKISDLTGAHPCPSDEYVRLKMEVEELKRERTCAYQNGYNDGFLKGRFSHTQEREDLIKENDCLENEIESLRDRLELWRKLAKRGGD